MDKDVLIRICGLQTLQEDGAPEPVEVVVPGEYYVRSGKKYLRYEELMDDSTEPTINYIKICPLSIEVRKKGLVDVHMVFEPGKKNMTYYTTPFGTLEMGIATTGIDVVEKEERLDVKIEYSLDMNSEHVADCFLTIQAGPVQSPGFSLS